jgi:hypothetical protein
MWPHSSTTQFVLQVDQMRSAVSEVLIIRTKCVAVSTAAEQRAAGQRCRRRRVAPAWVEVSYCRTTRSAASPSFTVQTRITTCPRSQYRGTLPSLVRGTSVDMFLRGSRSHGSISGTELFYILLECNTE